SAAWLGGTRLGGALLALPHELTVVRARVVGLLAALAPAAAPPPPASPPAAVAVVTMLAVLAARLALHNVGTGFVFARFGFRLVFGMRLSEIFGRFFLFFRMLGQHGRGLHRDGARGFERVHLLALVDDEGLLAGDR